MAEDSEDKPSPKRARRHDQDGGFRMEPDLLVVVEDEVFEVHALVLMLASPVWARMLSSQMGEGLRREVKLPGKSRREFGAFWRSLQLYTMEPLTRDSAIFLSQWADEYQVDALKQKCEDYLLSSVPVDGESLRHAVACGLKRRTEQCIKEMQRDIAKYVDQLAVLASSATEEQLCRLWPSICEAAGVQAFDMPSVEKVAGMWPFLMQAVRSAVPAAAFDKLARDAKTWARELYQELPRTAGADVKGRDFLIGKLRGHKIESTQPIWGW